MDVERDLRWLAAIDSCHRRGPVVPCRVFEHDWLLVLLHAGGVSWWTGLDRLRSEAAVPSHSRRAIKPAVSP